jgi:Lar family restriction alleviation protein
MNTEDAELVELKACPFCGGEAELDDLGDPNDDSFVHCTRCDVQQIANYGAAKASERWNTRATASGITRVEEARLLRSDCEFLLSVIDSCDEAEAPSCEMDPEDTARIDYIRAALAQDR